MGSDAKKTMELEQTENDDDIFDGIMAHVGLKGYFQRRFNFIFNLVYVMLIAMPCMNHILIMTVPDHWCHVPGRNTSNYTVDEWRQLTIPRDEAGTSFLQCKMYNGSFPNESGADSRLGSNLSETRQTIDCQYGWDYDKTWYTLTVPSQNDWVCDDQLKVTNIFALTRIADVIGTFVFGQLADTIGRQPVFFIALLFLCVGRISSAFVAYDYTLFLIATMIASFAVSPAFQSPLVISMEVSASDKRAHIAMMQCLGWTAGICLMPMLAWMSYTWFDFLLMSSIPCVLFFFLYRQFPESPRWLATRGRPVPCVKALQYMCRVNGTVLPEDTMSRLRRLQKTTEKTYGFASLFSSRRLAINTLIISLSWVVNSLVYFVLILNITNMAGNPYMNFFWQSLVELPGYIAGRLLSDRFGRRWTQTSVMLTIPIFALGIVFAIKTPSLEWFSVGLVILIKMCVTTTFYVVYLQALEIYPTCVRQTGTSCGTLFANALGVLGPYIVYLGTAYDVRYPFVIVAIITLVGGICTAFLPETLNQKLPETLVDAQHFGENQTFWSVSYTPVKLQETHVK